MNENKTLIFSALVIEVSCIAMVCLGNLRENVPAFLMFYFFAFVAYCLAIPLWTGKKNDSHGAIIFCCLGAVFFRITLLTAQPSLSDDIYRYLWDGRVQAHGLNPYLYSPDSVELEFLRDDIYEGVNHRGVNTIYPPFAQVFF